MGKTLGGARRVAKTGQDGKGNDRGEADHVSSYATRTEPRSLPRKRSAGEMNRSMPVQESRKSSILEHPLSESPRDGHERKRSSVSSAKSSLSGDDLLSFHDSSFLFLSVDGCSCSQVHQFASFLSGYSKNRECQSE